MKYCVSARQPKTFLKKVDEVIVQARDYRYISELFVDCPHLTIILDVPREEFENLKNSIIEYSKISDKFICRIYDLNTVEFFKENNIKFYYGYSVNSFYEIRGLVDLGVEYIRIHAPLTFNIYALSKIDCKFRMVPNVAFDAYIPRNNGICGQWIRPEDIKYYEDGIAVFEFEDANLDKEQTLFHIYAEQGEWKGNLNLLITNLNIDADNRGLPEDIGETRANCGQRCMVTGTCHLCQGAFSFEKAIRTHQKELRELIKESKTKE